MGNPSSKNDDAAELGQLCVFVENMAEQLRHLHEDAERVLTTLYLLKHSPAETSDDWRPIETADVNHLFATSTWVLIQRDDGFVTEAMPHYFSGGGYIWMTARGDNCRGSKDQYSGMLRHDVTHWRPLPSPLKTSALPSPCTCSAHSEPHYHDRPGFDLSTL